MEKLFWSYTTTLETTPASTPRAREFVRSQLERHQLALLTDAVQLVVSELADMLVSHHEARSFTVRLIGGGGEVLLLVQEGSTVAFERLASGHATDGHPLLGTQRVSDRWGIDLTRPGGAAVWASFAADLPQ